MDRNRVLLLTLIWIIQCVWGVRTQDNATDTTYYQDITTDVTDITELTSDVDVDSRNDSAENFQLDRICSWSISGTKKGLRIDWSGNATAESEVVVDAFSNDPNCRYASGETKEKFSNKFADLTLCLNTRYVITVQFNCSTSETSREIWTPPEPPPGVLIENVDNTSFGVSWSRPSGKGRIELYNVSVSDLKGFHLLQNSSAEKMLVSDLEPWTVYRVRVASKNEDFWGEYSKETEVQTKVGIPGTPRNLRQTAIGNTSVTLNWDPPSVNTGPMSKYIVHWQNSSAASEEDTTSNSTSYTVAHLAPFVQYTFKVSAVTKAGQGNWSEVLTIQTTVGIPYAPVNLKNTSVSNTSVGLRWEEPKQSTGPISSYRVQWKNSTVEREEATLSNATFHTVKGLWPYAEYTFKVAAVTEVGRGTWSGECIVRTEVGKPYPPENLTIASFTNTSIGLTWDSPTLSTGPIFNYHVHWRNSTHAFEVDTPSNLTSYTVQKLRPYSVYTFKVLAVTEAGPGLWSDERHASTDIGIPDAPINLQDTSVTNTSVSLKWNEPPVSMGPLLSYRIFWRNASAGGSEDTPRNETFYTMKNLTPYVLYTFGVSAVTKAGAGEASEEIEVQTDVGVPHAPVNLKQITFTNTSVSLKWEEPSVSTGPILRYRIHWRNSSRAGWEDTSTNDTFHTLERLTPFVKYTFTVSAITDAGTGESSEELTVQTKVGVPHAPREVTVTKMTNTSVYLKWNEPSVSTGPIVGYRIHWKNSSKDGEEDTNSTTLFYTVQHLTPYVDYTFRVLALTAAGPGEWSKQVKDRTKVGVPHAPRDVTLTKMTNTSAALKWNKPSISTGPIVGYRIHWKNSSSEGEENTKSTTPIYTVQHLTPYIDYTFRVLALTSAGPGEWSKQVKDRTKVGVPHAVEKFSTTHVGNTSIDLAWNAPRVSTGPILKYRVRWKNSTTSGEEDTPSNSTRYKLQRLAPYVYYNLKSLAITEAGPGPWSKEVTVQTKIGVPHPPTQLTDSDVTNTSALLTWSEPMPSTGPIMSYTVHWNSTRGGGFNDTGERSFNVSNLFPYLNYTFTVSASTAAGRGEWSRSIVVETDIGVPSTPKKLRYKHVTNTTLSLKWNRPDYPNAPELEYRLTYRLMLRDDLHPVSMRIVVPASQESVSHVLPNLLPYTYYSIRVSAGSPAGESSDSDELIVRTEIGVPLPAKILDVKAMKRKTALLRWITEGPYPGPVDYTLETRKFPGLCSGSEKETVTKEMKGNQKADEWRREHVMEIGNLSPFGVYQFRILLKTSATEKDVVSQMSFMIRIAPEAPSEPLDIRAECIGSPTELKISWKPPKEPNGLITSYRIQYGIERKNLTRLLHVNNMCQSQSYILTGLRPERRYLIAISARVENVSEDGTSSQPSSVCTLPPGIPFLGDTSSLQAEGSGSESLELVWTKEVFSDYMGYIVQYAVLVGRTNTLGNATSGTRTSVSPPWFNFSSGYSDFYQATPPGWNPSLGALDPLGCRNHTEGNHTVLRCTLGLDKNCPRNETYCNGPLKPDTLYELKIRAFTRAGFTETDPIHARSSPIPKPSVGGKVAAVVVVLLLLAALVGGGYVMKKKGRLDKVIVRIQSHLNPKEEPPPKQEEPPMQMEECNTPKPIKTKYFAEHVRIMMSDSHLKFSLEFEKLKNESPRLPCTIAEMEENRAKNRWMNIFPFDHSRVKLLPLCDEPGSDFINANYIPGYSSRREYIATQGPLPHVLDDFWRMVWEQSVNVIVMLTQCVERGKKKCEKYWPDSGDTQYHGDLRITTVSVSMLSSYIIRIFHIQSGSYERLVKQMHFTHWPDFGCPECPEDLINFVSAVREHLPRVAPGPILVHCSAGVGRTGTFIAVDRLMLQLQHAGASNHGEDTVDVYGTVLDLRQHRTNMVQTEDQYIYIHLCVRQLIEDRDRPRATGSQENIYSNLAIERDLPRSIKPTAPELPR